LHKNCFLKTVIEGNIEGTGRRRRRVKQLLDDPKQKKKIIVLEKGRTKSHSVERSLWNRPGTCRKTDYGMINEIPSSM
jgi:hypothetical protein